jgi:hypothetical protein
MRPLSRRTNAMNLAYLDAASGSLIVQANDRA